MHNKVGGLGSLERGEEKAAGSPSGGTWLNAGHFYDRYLLPLPEGCRLGLSVAVLVSQGLYSGVHHRCSLHPGHFTQVCYFPFPGRFGVDVLHQGQEVGTHMLGKGTRGSPPNDRMASSVLGPGMLKEELQAAFCPVLQSFPGDSKSSVKIHTVMVC